MFGGNQSVRGCADEYEDRRAAQVADATVPYVAELKTRDRTVAHDGVHLDMTNDLDVRVALDPASEVVGHAFSDVASAEQERDPGGVFGEEHRGLTG